MTYVKGQILYDANVSADEDTGRLRGSLDEYEIRTIRGNKVYSTKKIVGITWIKKSKKHFDYGWASSIDPVFRRMIRKDDNTPALGTTKRGAWVACKRSCKAIHKWRRAHYAEGLDEETITTYKKSIVFIDKKIAAFKKQKVSTRR